MKQITENQYSNLTNLQDLRAGRRVISNVCFEDMDPNNHKLFKVHGLLWEMINDLQYKTEGIISEDEG